MKTGVALLLLALAFRLSSAADAEGWKSQILYFAITDRFAQAPGVKPLGPCKLTGWNNGTWSGITQHLDYIKDLGMTAIWITPIPKQYDADFFGETGYHGYWAQDWTRLEPRFGTEDDLQTLIRTAKQKGVKMMLDVVGNHVGPIGDNFSAIIPYNKPEHYHSCVNTCDNFCNIPQSAYDSNPQQYTVIEQCRLQGLPDLNQTNPEVKDGLIQWLKSTLAKFDFDGLRVDTVKHVDPDFWRAYTEAAGRFTLGEVLNGDNMNMLRYTEGPKPAMNSVLNFPMYYHLNNVYAQKQDMRQLATERQKQYTILGNEVVSTMGNFIDNHDTPRFLTVQPDEQLLRNALAWVLIADGIPTIYYGTASGVKGENYAGRNRGCLWEQGYKEDTQLYKTVQTLAKLRTVRQLWKLPERTVAATADCFVFSRGPDVLVVTTNRGSNSAGSCTVELPKDSVLLSNGVSGIHDVLAAPKGHDNGIVWYPKTRHLIISTPNGSPRVLTSTPFTPQHINQGKAEIANCTTECPLSAAAKAIAGNNSSSGVTSAAGSAAPGVLVALALLLHVLVL